MDVLEIYLGEKVYGNNLTGSMTCFIVSSLSLSHSSLELNQHFVVFCENPGCTKAARSYSLRDCRSVLCEATNELMCCCCFGKLIYVP